MITDKQGNEQNTEIAVQMPQLSAFCIYSKYFQQKSNDASTGASMIIALVMIKKKPRYA